MVLQSSRVWKGGEENVWRPGCVGQIGCLLVEARFMDHFIHDAHEY